MKLTLLTAIALALSSAGCTTYFETPTSSTKTTTVTADLDTFTSRVARGGFASRSFTLAAAGTIQATLSDVAPTVPIGFGVGIPQSDGGGCNLTRSMETLPATSPQIEITADAGSYCVKVFDMGGIEESVSFTVKVAHP